MQINDPVQRIFGLAQHGLRLPNRDEFKQIPERIRHFLKNPAGSGPVWGTIGSILFMEGVNLWTTFLHSPEGRAIIEAIAGLGELGGLAAKIAIKGFEDWLRYNKTANVMIMSVKNGNTS